MSYTKLFYHLVWRTYSSEPSIPEWCKEEVQRHIHSLCINNKWILKQVNTHLDHVHALVQLPPSVSVSTVAQTLKSVSSQTFKGHKNFPLFKGWNTGYGAFTVSSWDVAKIRSYIKNQSEHHKNEDTRGELMRMLSEHEMDPNQYFDENW
ncbi:MAG: IS200/IS605 family transposase [Bacteroidales bacterium]|nr:IS200/IS605 family transposase [Bacteroidales bacterium]